MSTGEKVVVKIKGCVVFEIPEGMVTTEGGALVVKDVKLPGVSTAFVYALRNGEYAKITRAGGTVFVGVDE